MPKVPNIRIGTSGWHYAHWQQRFYPDKLPKSSWLEYYSHIFDTVEINNTFYQLPKLQSVERWYQNTPQNFLFTVKANRYITHIKRLKDASEPLNRFFDAVGAFKEKCGPILYQLPPNFQLNLSRLESFLKILPPDHLSVFEFRHKSWFSRDTLELLDQYNAVFCVHDMPDLETPRTITGKAIYLRFHGPSERYAGSYSDKTLTDWSHWITDNLSRVKKVFVYFNNDTNAYAVNNAKTLSSLLNIK